MNKLRSANPIFIVDLVMTASFVLALCLTIYCVYLLKKPKEPFCVTYTASFISLNPCKLCIIYQDSTQIVTCYTDEQTWSKQVCLPSTSSAFLMVEPVYRDPISQGVIADDFWMDDSLSSVLAKITCGTSSTWQSGQSFATAHYNR